MWNPNIRKELQKPIMKPCPEPVQSSSYFHNPVPNICYSTYYPLTYGQVSQVAGTLPLHFRENCVCARVCVRERMLPHACYLFLLHLIFLYFLVLIIFIFHGSTALVCVGQLIAEAPISPSVIHTHSSGNRANLLNSSHTPPP